MAAGLYPARTLHMHLHYLFSLKHDNGEIKIVLYRDPRRNISLNFNETVSFVLTIDKTKKNQMIFQE